MAKLTITNTRPVRRNIAIASLQDKSGRQGQGVHPQRWIAKLRTSTPRTTHHPCPDERYNWPAEYGAGRTADRYNWHPTCEASALASNPSTVCTETPSRQQLSP